jgi:hypothetical protein
LSQLCKAALTAPGYAHPVTESERAELKHVADRDSRIGAAALVVALTLLVAAGSTGAVAAPAAPVDAAHSNAASALAPLAPAQQPLATGARAHAVSGGS